MKSRREFLKQVSRAALVAGAAPSMLTWALPQGQTVSVPGEDGMILRSFRFVDLESPVEYFNSWLTP
ncbi:MAG: twin-arginine translocation signal domain-containing protein, partial [Candidatus Sulfotelmatobacter sp.]